MKLESANLIKKKFIKPNNDRIAKMVFSNTSNLPIFRNKYELDNYLGVFTIKFENK